MVQHEGVAWLDRSLAAIGLEDSNQRARIRFECRGADGVRRIKVGLFLIYVYDSISMGCAGNHARAGKDSFDLPRFHREREHSSQDLRFTAYGGHFHASVLPAPGVAGDLLTRDSVEPLVRDGGIGQQPRRTILVTRKRLQRG